MVERAFQDMNNRKDDGIDGLPIELFKSLENIGVKWVTYLCNVIYEKSEWPDDFNSTANC